MNQANATIEILDIDLKKSYLEISFLENGVSKKSKIDLTIVCDELHLNGKIVDYSKCGEKVWVPIYGFSRIDGYGSGWRSTKETYVGDLIDDMSNGELKSLLETNIEFETII